MFRASSANAQLSGSGSVEEISQQNDDNQSTPALRNRYLKRVGVEAGAASDCEPLLDS